MHLGYTPVSSVRMGDGGAAAWWRMGGRCGCPVREGAPLRFLRRRSDFFPEFSDFFLRAPPASFWAPPSLPDARHTRPDARRHSPPPLLPRLGCWHGPQRLFTVSDGSPRPPGGIPSPYARNAALPSRMQHGAIFAGTPRPKYNNKPPHFFCPPAPRPWASRRAPARLRGGAHRPAASCAPDVVSAESPCGYTPKLNILENSLGAFSALPRPETRHGPRNHFWEDMLKIPPRDAPWLAPCTASRFRRTYAYKQRGYIDMVQPSPPGCLPSPPKRLDAIASLPRHVGRASRAFSAC